MATATNGARCDWAGLVDRHFQGRIQPDDEVAMRAHLGDCQLCRKRYDRQILLGDLTRSAGLGGRPLDREDRLALGLGLPAAGSRGPLGAAGSWPVLGLALALGVGALTLFLHGGRNPDATPASETFSASPVGPAGSSTTPAPTGTSVPGTLPGAAAPTVDGGASDAGTDTRPLELPRAP